MVVWQNRLNADHEFEFLAQQSIGRRKWKWLRNYDPRGVAARTLKFLLARKLRKIADRLEREALAETSTSMSVERYATAITASRLPSTKSVERLESTSSVMQLAM